MAKKGINLVIKKETETILIRRFKIVLPIIALVGLGLFIIMFVTSIIYINTNIMKYNMLKREIDQSEKRISSQKNVEGIYTLTSSRLNTLEQLSSQVYNFPPIISEIDGLQSETISVQSADADNKNNISFSVIASSSAAFDDFINLLINNEQKKRFSKIEGHGIIRDKKGNYLMTVTLNIDPSVIK